MTVDNTAPAAPVVTPLQSPVAGSPTLSWPTTPGRTYTVARTQFDWAWREVVRRVSDAKLDNPDSFRLAPTRTS